MKTREEIKQFKQDLQQGIVDLKAAADEYQKRYEETNDVINLGHKVNILSTIQTNENVIETLDWVLGTNKIKKLED